MPSLKAIKKRITSVKNTQKITRAMKLVSAAKMRRATEKAQASRPFEKELSGIVSSILARFGWKSPLLAERPLKKVALVVISSDRGLCGSLNSNLMKAVFRYLESLPQGVEVDAFALGKKARTFLRKRGIRVVAEHLGLQRSGRPEYIAEISRELRAKFLDETYDRVDVVYPKFVSALSQVPTTTTLLPFVPSTEELAGDFIYEPAPQEILNELVPMLLDFRLYRYLLEAIASEHAARMSAMESATNNAKDMIGRLTLERNRARQAAITKELMEIIGGAEALAG